MFLDPGRCYTTSRRREDLSSIDSWEMFDELCRWRFSGRTPGNGSRKGYRILVIWDENPLEASGSTAHPWQREESASQMQFRDSSLTEWRFATNAHPGGGPGSHTGFNLHPFFSRVEDVEVLTGPRVLHCRGWRIVVLQISFSGDTGILKREIDR